jgi:hypothetical protein
MLFCWKEPAMHKTAWMMAGLTALLPLVAMAADGDTVNPSPEELRWARWQGRLSLGATPPAWSLGVESPSSRIATASLMGDYYFSRSLVSAIPLGGFRATSGLIFGTRSVLSTGQPASLSAVSTLSVGSRLLGQSPIPYLAETSSDSATLPYVGVGYTGLTPRSGWSFSADLGLVAQSPGNAVRLGRVFGGGQSLDDVVRDMRLAPLLQLGVSYSF